MSSYANGNGYGNGMTVGMLACLLMVYCGMFSVEDGPFPFRRDVEFKFLEEKGLIRYSDDTWEATKPGELLCKAVMRLRPVQVWQIQEFNDASDLLSMGDLT